MSLRIAVSLATMLEQTWELNVVTESSGYRATPPKLIEELLAELLVPYGIV